MDEEVDEPAVAMHGLAPAVPGGSTTASSCGSCPSTRATEFLPESVPRDVALRGNGPHKKLLEAFKANSLKHGGPHRYLQKRFDADERKLEFANLLVEAFPLAPTMENTHTKDIPRTTPSNDQGVVVVVVHPSVLSFAPAASPQ